MLYINDYGKFIMESVYLKRYPFKKYSFIVNRESNFGTVNLVLNNDDKINFNIETYNSKDNASDVFIIHINHLLHMVNIDEIIELFNKVLNKNRLGYKFNIEKHKVSKYSSNYYYLVKVNKEITIIEFEQIVNSTKIINSKVKIGDEEDFDKIIYKTL